MIVSYQFNAGAIASILSGTVTTLLWKEAAFIKNIVPENIYSNMDEVLPAITISTVLLVVVSLFGPGQKKSHNRKAHRTN